MISKDQFWKIAGVTQHIQFENYLRKIVFDPKKRNDFFKQLMKVKQEIPRWRHKYQEGLNIKLEDIGKIPFNIPINWLLPFEEQQRLKEERGYV